MKSKSLLLLGIGAGALVYFGSKAANIKQAISKLTASNPKIQIAFQGLKIVLDITVDILNPGSVDIPFEYYTGIVLYDKTKIADFTYNANGKNILLKARSATPLKFKVNIATAGTIFKLTKVIKALTASTSNVDTTMAVQSSIYAAGLDVPINFIYDLKKQEIISGIGCNCSKKCSNLNIQTKKYLADYELANRTNNTKSTQAANINNSSKMNSANPTAAEYKEGYI